MTAPTTTTITTTTAYRAKAKVAAKEEAEVFKTEEADRVLVQPVVVEAAYPNLVSINKRIRQQSAKLIENLLAEFESNIKSKLFS